MPKYSRAEFQEAFQLTPQNISNMKSRGKLVFDGKEIDLDQPINKAWFESWKEKNPNNPLVHFGKKSKPSRSRKKKIEENLDTEDYTDSGSTAPIQFDENEEISTRDIEQAGAHDLTTYKKKLEVLKLQKEYEYKKIQVDKQQGLVIPTELAIGAFKRHFKSVNDSFAQSVDNMLVEIVQALGGKQSDLAHYRSRLIEELNQSIGEAESNSLKEIDALKAEYSETRGKGERKN